MPFEVEMKFPLDDSAALQNRLDAFQAKQQAPLQQCDRYFNHPSRDFAETDEALRIRTSADTSRITYKGPLLDKQTKTRRELEIPIGANANDAERMAEILTQLGFREVRAVRKTRTPFLLSWENRDWELVLDNVVGLGQFVEIETTAQEDDLDAARKLILRLATELGLDPAQTQRQSYLQLLLEKE